MLFLEPQIKGITRYLLDADLGGEPLHVHISEVGPGQRAHPPHRHGGLEAFYNSCPLSPSPKEVGR